MPGLRPARSATTVARTGKTKGAVRAKAPTNCGSGSGGFKPGNICGKGKRQALAEHLKAARAKANAGDGHHATIREHARALRDHRRGKAESITNDEARRIRDHIRVGAPIKEIHAIRPHEARVGRLAEKLREYDKAKPATLADAHAHLDRIVSGHTHSEIKAGIQRAGMGDLNLPTRGKTVEVLKSLHESGIRRREQRANDTRTAREARADGQHRLSNREVGAIRTRIARKNDVELDHMEERYRQSYNQSGAGGGLNMGERARFRRVLREIDAERGRRASAATVAKKVEAKAKSTKETKAEKKDREENARIGASLPEFGESQPRFAFPVSGASVTRMAKADVERMGQEIFGRKMTPENLASIAGAPDGSMVRFGKSSGSTPKMYVYTEISGVMTSERSLTKGHDGKVVMENESFFVEKQHQNQGHAYSVFGRQIENARKHGVSHIDVHACRSNSMNGYSTWAKFGYQGAIPYTASERLSGDASLPEHIRKAQTVQELMATPEGRKAWEKHGASWEGQFDLSPESAASKAWTNYRIRKTRERNEKST